MRSQGWRSRRGISRRRSSLCEEALATGARSGDSFVSPKGTWRTGLLFTYAQTLAVLGYPDQAATCCDEAVEEVRTLRHDYSLVVSLGNACSVDLICRRHRLLRERVEEMISVAAERGFPTWLARGRIYRGWLLADDPASIGRAGRPCAPAWPSCAGSAPRATLDATSICWPTPAVGRTNSAKGSTC